jgi:hypothetical protein
VAERWPFVQRTCMEWGGAALAEVAVGLPLLWEVDNAGVLCRWFVARRFSAPAGRTPVLGDAVCGARRGSGTACWMHEQQVRKGEAVITAGVAR